jgi:glycosyltransferase involved in cell wall biosynthesis
MNKTLLAITTFNQIEYTKQMLESIFADKDRNYDVILVDDFSTDGTVEYAKSIGIPVITKPCGRGATDSWNLAYHFFRFSSYENLFIANNDVIIPVGCMNELIKNAEDDCIVIPVANFHGSGENKNCSISSYFDVKIDPEKPEYAQTIQDAVLKTELKPFKKTIDWAAFLFGFNRSALIKERFGNLFTPYNINIHQEREMKDLFAIKIVPTAYAYHFKAKTLKADDNTRNDLRTLHKGVKEVNDGYLVIKWKKEGKNYMIDNVFAYPFTLIHIMMMLSKIIHVSSLKFLEDEYGESGDCNLYI